MTGQTETQTDPDQEMGLRALAFLAVVVLLLVFATYFFGLGALLAVAIVGSFVMLGIIIYLSSPTQKT